MSAARAARRFAAIVLPVGLLLAACSNKPPQATEANRVCPRVEILEYADQLTQFIPGPGRDITDIVFRGNFARYTGECEVDDEEVTVTLTLDFAVERGPSFRGQPARFQYFVAIPQFHPRPEGKRTFPVTIPFDEGRSRALYRDEINIEIPLDRRERSRNYNIFLGFQLDKDQLEYNRRGARRR